MKCLIWNSGVTGREGTITIFSIYNLCLERKERKILKMIKISTLNAIYSPNTCQVLHKHQCCAGHWESRNLQDRQGFCSQGIRF